MLKFDGLTAADLSAPGWQRVLAGKGCTDGKRNGVIEAHGGKLFVRWDGSKAHEILSSELVGKLDFDVSTADLEPLRATAPAETDAQRIARLEAVVSRCPPHLQETVRRSLLSSPRQTAAAPVRADAEEVDPEAAKAARIAELKAIGARARPGEVDASRAPAVSSVPAGNADRVAELRAAGKAASAQRFGR